MSRKKGVTRKPTLLHTKGKLVVKIPKGTFVMVNNRKLNFGNMNKTWVTKLSGKYFLTMYGDIYEIEFPGGGKVPYPLSML